MHEMSIITNLLEVVKEQVKEHQLKQIWKVHLIVGSLTGVVPDALKFCWKISIEKTPIEGAELSINQRSAVALCNNCSNEYELKQNSYSCPRCGGAIRQLLSGKELYIDFIEGD